MYIILSLINDILDIAKIEAGKRAFTDVEVDPARVAGEAMSFVEPMAHKAGVTLGTEIDGTLRLRADERALTQILTNLLSNAVKFGRAGGYATVFARLLPGGALALGVADNGIGMSEPDLDKALEFYGQASDATTVEGRGTGLGLPIVKALIEAHGAVFRIESLTGEGTRVWGEFPSSRVIATRAAA